MRNLPIKSEFIMQVILSSVGGFIPDERTDLVEKEHLLSGRQKVLLFCVRVTKRSRIEVKVSKSSVLISSTNRNLSITFLNARYTSLWYCNKGMPTYIHYQNAP